MAYLKPQPLVSLKLLVVLLIATTLITSCVTTTVPKKESDTEAVNPSGKSASRSDQRLTVLDWAGFQLEDFRTEFVKQNPQTRVDYTLFQEDAEAFSKLQGGFPADIVHPCIGFWGLYVEAGLVQPIDTSKLKHWPDVYEELARIGQFHGEQYFVPWDWGFESILVRSDKVQSIPSSWADLADPEYKGRLALWDSGEGNHVMAALALGIEDPWNTTPSQDAAIKDWLINLKSNTLTFWGDSTDLTQAMAAGDVWIASNVWTETFAALRSSGVPVEYVEPKEGRIGFVCGYGISSEVKDIDLAHEYIDALLAPESMAAMSNTYWYGSSNRAAIPLINAEIVDTLELDNPGVLGHMTLYRPLSSEQRDRLTGMWNDVKAAR